MIRIGHGGASALAPANTLDSFDAAAEVGVDMIEFDVREHGRRLVLAHTILHARRRPLSFEVAARHLALPRFADIELNVDLKHAGCEAALLDGLRSYGLLERTLISSQVAGALDGIRRRCPQARLGISVGGRAARASRRWRDWRAAVLEGLAGGRWQAVMAQHRLIDQGLRERVGERGGTLFGWTVNDAQRIERLRRLGVDGVATADPRLFSTG